MVVSGRGTDNIIAKKTRKNGQTMINQTLYIKLNIEQ
jgi:hypothetical protein